MIHVIALIQVKVGKRKELLDLFKANLSTVREEKGCIRYFPSVDVATGLPPQSMDENMITIIETWESVEALRNHLASPHMAAFFEKEKALVNGSTIKILQEA